MNEIVTHHDTGQSPFDAIRRTDERGEYWMARDLMPIMTYPAWREFAPVIERAMASAAAQGLNPDDLFGVITEKSGGRPREDVRLARFAAYLVAMNGDPRKEAVANAQAYFAVKTREAETAVKEITGPELMARALLEAAETIKAADRARDLAIKEREAARSYARELEPKADSYDQFMSGDGTYSIGTVAKMLGLSQNKLFDLLRNAGILIAKGPMRNTPYQQYMHHFAVRAFEFERSDGTRGTSYTSRVQPGGIPFVSRKLGIAITEGAQR